VVAARTAAIAQRVGAEESEHLADILTGLLWLLRGRGIPQKEEKKRKGSKEKKTHASM